MAVNNTQAIGYEKNATEVLEYELIDISFGYDVSEDDGCWRVSEDGSEDTVESQIEYDADGVPMGASMEEIKMREVMIRDFFHKWGDRCPDSKILNNALQEYIYIKGITVIEAREHSAKSYRSTRAVFMLDEILKNALPVRRVAIKANDKNQGGFAFMLIMVFRHNELGTIKLTVGVKLSGQKVQYGISSLKPGEPLIKDQSRPKKKKKRRSH